MVRIKTILDVFCAVIFITTLLVNITRLNIVIGVGSFVVVVSTFYLNSWKNYQLKIPRWILNAAGLTFVIIFLFTIPIYDPVPKLLEIIVALFIVKWLEREKSRDYLQILALNLFLLVGYAFYTLKPSFMLVLLMSFLLGTSCLMLLTTYDESKPDKIIDLRIVRHNLILSVLLLVCSVPATIALFMILPRTNMPIFSFLNKSVKGHTGFSNTVTLGDVSDIQEEDSVIFRARLAPKIKKGELYWRGIVFDFFDGIKWSVKNLNIQSSPPKFPTQKGIIRQKIILEPYGEPYLFCLDFPVSISIKGKKVLFEPDKNIFLLSDPVINRIYYECSSLKANGFGRPSLQESQVYLQLPLKLPNRLWHPVKRLKKRDNPEKTISNFSKWLTSSFDYSLSELPASNSPLEEFLFRSRRGNCEYFASALGVMLRMAGIPSRLVAGYRGGHFQPMGKYFIVLQRDAHVWVEAYIDDKGWIRLDPTPNISPSSDFVKQRSFLFNLRLYTDILNYYWNQIVISYDLEKQIKVFRNLKTNLVQLTSLSAQIEQWRNFELKKVNLLFVFLLMAATFTGAAIFVFVILRKKYVLFRSPVERVYINFLKQLAILGVKRKSNSETLEELERRARRQLPHELSIKISTFITLYSRCLYGSRGFTPEKIRELREIVKQLKSLR